MRHPSAFPSMVLFAALVVVSAAPAAAAPVPFEGTLTIGFPGVNTCIDDPPPGSGACGWPLVVAASGAGLADVALTGGGQLASLALPAGVFAAQGGGVITDNYGPFWFPFYGITVDAGNGAGTFGPMGGVLPLAGTVKVCLFAVCPSAVANLTVPLSVVGADATATHAGSVNVTVVGGAWTTGTITVGLSPSPVAGNAGPGTLELVTPIYLSTNIQSQSFSVLSLGYARLALHYVPEPSTALLVALGAAGLAARGLRRR